MPNPAIPHVTLSQRLALLGLADQESELKNLFVKEGAKVHINPEDPHHAKRIAKLKVTSAKDLKRWLGVPEGAVRQDTPANAHGLRFLPFPSIPLKDQETQAQLMSYLLATTTPERPTVAEKKLLAHLDATVRETGMAIRVVLAADIHVEEGATLVIDKNIQILFGNHVIIEDGATIIMESPVSRIDCARIRFVRSS